MRLPLLALLALLVSTTGAQPQERATGASAERRPKHPPGTQTSAPGSDKQNQLIEVLREARDLTPSFEPPMRAYTLLQVALADPRSDPRQRIRDLQNAFAATVAMENGDLQQELQGDVLRELLSTGTAQVEPLLAQAVPDVRDEIRAELISHYARESKISAALALLDQAETARRFPYSAATAIMLVLPANKAAMRESLFARALVHYKSEDHAEEAPWNSDDLGNMVVRFWREVPPPIVLEAVDELLSVAKTHASQVPNIEITVSSSKGSASLESLYEFRLFQLLPVLEGLDKRTAEELLKDNYSLKPILGRYPQGLQYLDPTLRDSPLRKGESSELSVTLRMGQAAQGGQPDRTEADLENLSHGILERAKTDPEGALMAAIRLPQFSSRPDTMPRADTLEALAHATVDSSPKVAESALEELGRTIEDIPPLGKVPYLADMAVLYRRLGRKSDAKKAANAGLKAAEVLYGEDSDGEDPNQALKAYWPSTAAWHLFLVIMEGVSEQPIDQLVAEIPDSEIRTHESIALAMCRVGRSTPMLAVATQRNKHSSLQRTWNVPRQACPD